MSYIPPLVFSSVTLVDPAVTATISWLCGIEHLPGIFSWLGGGVVITGVAVIGYGERKRAAAEEQERTQDECGTSDNLEEGEGVAMLEDDAGDNRMPSTSRKAICAVEVNEKEKWQVERASTADTPRHHEWTEVEMHPMRVVTTQSDDCKA